MSTDQLYQRIENYLTGRMSASENTAFENEISKDPALKSEVEFQKDIIEGLKMYRKQQLKASLSQVNVSPWSNFISSGLGKITSGIVATSVMVGSVYMIADSFEESERDSNLSYKTITVDAPFDTNIPDITIEDKPESNDGSEKLIVKASDQETINLDETTKEITENSTSDNTEILAPDISLPEDVDELTDNSDFESEEISSEIFDSPVPSADEKMDVNVENTNSEVLRYRYFEGKLNLYGNFKDTTYQILEVIGSDGKELYLFYKNSYYELSSNSEIQVLMEITDQSKIDQLEILKNHK